MPAPHRRRFLAAALAPVVLAPVFGAGCGKSESQTNPDLKVPEIPPSDRGTKGGAAKDPKAKK